MTIIDAEKSSRNLNKTSTTWWKNGLVVDTASECVNSRMVCWEDDLNNGSDRLHGQSARREAAQGLRWRQMHIRPGADEARR